MVGEATATATSRDKGRRRQEKNTSIAVYAFLSSKCMHLPPTNLNPFIFNIIWFRNHLGFVPFPQMYSGIHSIPLEGTGIDFPRPLTSTNLVGDPCLVLTTDPKPRLRWTAELHERFVDAVTQLGGPDSQSILHLFLSHCFAISRLSFIVICLWL